MLLRFPRSLLFRVSGRITAVAFPEGSHGEGGLWKTAMPLKNWELSRVLVLIKKKVTSVKNRAVIGQQECQHDSKSV